jgi:hypothetical protein
MLLRIALLSLLAAAAACSSLMIDPLEQLRDGNKQNLAKLAPGMTRMEVESVMGHARAGGKLPEVLFGRVQYLEAKNPMREEKNGDQLVLYYYTDVKSLDDRITDDELTPVVLRDGKVVGVGAQFLKR